MSRFSDFFKTVLNEDVEEDEYEEVEVEEEATQPAVEKPVSLTQLKHHKKL